jgi:NitT/TauT family transport system ATP-binding protein
MTDFHDSFINLDDTKQPIITKKENVGNDIINLSNIEQIYDNGKIKIFDKMDFCIPDIKTNGQFTAILGPSGCGKSTILRYISGLQKPTSGSIKINGIEQTEKDRIGMVFQQYSSLPWRTVLDNVCLPLELKGIKKSERIELGMEMIKLVGLDGQENKYAQYPILSGGQLQRVALARNLVTHEKIMLLDEPHGALDMKTKLEMDDLLSSIWRKIMEQDPTFLLVTHDVNEAVYLANEIIIMGANPGRIVEQINIDLPIERNSKIKRTKQFIDFTSYIEDKMLQLKTN